MSSQVVPIQTLHLFPELNKLLISLLKSLSTEDWSRQTIAPLWTVKDIAAHLLDTNIRSISAADRYNNKGPENINSYRDLVTYLNELNAVWVKAMERVSPQQLINLLEITNQAYVDYLASLDPFAPAKFSVAWAGERQSANWFHVAREYTEKWHHQQQIRDAVNRPGLMYRDLFYPCIDTFMCALPLTYRDEMADTGTLIAINVSGEAGGTWYLEKGLNKWKLINAITNALPDASVTIDPDIAWKVFTKGIKPELAIKNSILTGDHALAKKIFDLIAVMA